MRRFCGYFLVYQILSDPEKRALYDKCGEKCVNGEGESGFDNIFDMFFKPSTRAERGNKMRKAQDVRIPLFVSLKEIYLGTEVTVAAFT